MISHPIDLDKHPRHWFFDSKFYVWLRYSFVGKRCRRVYWKFIGNPCYQVKRLWEWYKNVFKNDFDFDGHCLYRIIAYKLSRVETSLKAGYAIQEPKDMKALKLAIKLANRLAEDEYEDHFYRRHELKWGKSKHSYTPAPGGSYYMHSSRPNAKTPEEERQSNVEFIDSMRRAAEIYKREAKWLYSILTNHLEVWWD